MARSLRLRILAFEPFDAGSHRAVRESISRHSRHEWMWITRPGRAWKWRMRLGAAEMIGQAHRQGEFARRPDLIFATSLMGSAELRALLPAELRSLPLVLYMHENQAAYPLDRVRWREEAGNDGGQVHHDAAAAQSKAGAERPPDVQFALTNLTSVLAADVVVWNSRWNLRSFMNGIESILQHASDLALDDWRERIERKSCVIWPPVEVLHKPEMSGSRDGGAAPANGGAVTPIRVAWPHRWEHDKGPDELLLIARQHTRSRNLRWTILGEQFRNIPASIEAFRSEFADRIDHIGFEPDRCKYWRRLSECDWVLSTARHEFFGIAVAEALLAGCLPWLPASLSYVEMLPLQARTLSPMNPPPDGHVVRTRIREHLEPAIASNAVRAIDEVIDCVCAQDSSTA